MVTTSMTVVQSQISTRLQLKEVEDAIDLDHVRMNQAMLWRLSSNKNETELQLIADKKLHYVQQATKAHSVSLCQLAQLEQRKDQADLRASNDSLTSKKSNLQVIRPESKNKRKLSNRRDNKI